MIAAQPVTSGTVAPTMLQGIVETLGDRPGDTTGQREARSRDVVDAVLGFQPRDPVELMLAGMVVTHVHLVQDSAREALHGQDEALKTRTKSTIVALDRGMIGLLKELRVAQGRTIEYWAGVEQPRMEATRAPAQPHTPAQPRTEAAKPRVPPVPRVPRAELLQRTMPRPPVPLLPPLRTTEISIVAMMAVLSPPTKPYVEPTSVAKPSGVTATRSHTQPPKSPLEADREPEIPSHVVNAPVMVAESAPVSRAVAAPGSYADVHGLLRPAAVAR